MPASLQALRMLGLTNDEAVFRQTWLDHGYKTIDAGPGEVITHSVQEALRNPESRKAFGGFARKSLHKMASGAIRKGALESGDVSGITPLVHDPEILGILKEDAPLVARVPVVGQRGFKAVYPKITARGGPVGFVSENDSLILTDDTPSESTYGKGEVDMEIVVDLVQIGDFAQAGGEHYFSLRDTEMGQRLIALMQHKEKAYLYGDKTKGKTDGSPFDDNAYNGLAKIYNAAGQEVDKSAVDISGTKALLNDIKSEIKSLLQGANNVNKGDLEIWCSHTMFDELENELDVSRRIDANEQSVNHGFEVIRISGVPVFASHNIQQHTFGQGGATENVGDDGDVFIVNRRATQFRALAPLSTVPLGRRGLSEEAALFEFGALIDRADGKFGKYLKAYAI